jgi:hypothetical protein
MNVTVPVAVVPVGGCTVAVKVTSWPNVDGFALETTVTAVEP